MSEFNKLIDSSFFLFTFLSRQLELLALQDFGHVKIEEITVEDRLDNSGKDGNQIIVVLADVAINPIQNVQGSIRSERKQIVTCDRLSLASLGYHEQLRKNSHGLQVNAPCPKDFDDRELMINDEGQNCDRN